MLHSSYVLVLQKYVIPLLSLQVPLLIIRLFLHEVLQSGNWPLRLMRGDILSLAPLTAPQDQQPPLGPSQYCCHTLWPRVMGATLCSAIVVTLGNLSECQGHPFGSLVPILVALGTHSRSYSHPSDHQLWLLMWLPVVDLGRAVTVFSCCCLLDSHLCPLGIFRQSYSQDSSHCCNFKTWAP